MLYHRCITRHILAVRNLFPYITDIFVLIFLHYIYTLCTFCGCAFNKQQQKSEQQEQNSAAIYDLIYFSIGF